MERTHSASRNTGGELSSGQALEGGIGLRVDGSSGGEGDGNSEELHCDGSLMLVMVMGW